jgi:prephenate dehydratase
VLTSIADGGVNLSKLQSVPIPGSDFKYSFHADMEFSDKAQFDSVLNDIEKQAEDVRVFGVYKKGIFKK